MKKEKSEEVKPVIGKYKTKDKFIDFVGGKGNLNFISNEATIDGKYLTGLELDGIIFKLTICDGDTVNFDEVDTNVTTSDQRSRLLEVISDKTVVPYRQRTVVTELPFMSVQKVKDKNVSLYLSVECQTPMSKLTSLLDDDGTECLIDVSDDAMDNLDSILSWFDDEEFANSIAEMINEENSQVVEDVKGVIDDTFIQHHDTSMDVISQVENSFSKMKEEKLDELKSKRSKKEEEIVKYNYQISSIEKTLEETKSDLKLIEERIDDLQPIEPSNGYYFNVSERQNESVVLEPGIEKIIREKLSKVKSINTENFMKLFVDGEYQIRIGQDIYGSIDEVTDYKNLSVDIMKSLDKVSVFISSDKLIYQGDKNWADIVNKMIKNGFNQSPEFDKKCGSNSFGTKIETKEEINKNLSTF